MKEGVIVEFGGLAGQLEDREPVERALADAMLQASWETGFKSASNAVQQLTPPPTYLLRLLLFLAEWRWKLLYMLVLSIVLLAGFMLLCIAMRPWAALYAQLRLVFGVPFMIADWAVSWVFDSGSAAQRWSRTQWTTS